jgi:hypothetical protein
MNDNFNSKWKEFNYMGRGEPFYTYEGFTRNISLTFTILAHSGPEMASIWTKIDYLMSTMAPDYNTKNQMRGNYCYMTVGDYMYRQPGIIDSLQITDLFGQNQTGWEIAMNEPDTASPNQAIDDLHYEMPKMIKITLGFKPIHNFLPKRMYSSDENYTATFVTPNHNLLKTRNRYLPSEPAIIPTTNTEDKNPQPKPLPQIEPTPEPQPRPRTTPKPAPIPGGSFPDTPNFTYPKPTWGNNTQDNTLVNDPRYGRGPRPFVRQDEQFGGGGGFNGGGAGGGF